MLGVFSETLKKEREILRLVVEMWMGGESKCRRVRDSWMNGQNVWRLEEEGS